MTRPTECPDCGRDGIRHGLREVQQSFLTEAGLLRRRAVSVQRYRCTDCDRSFQDPPGAEHAAAMNAVVESILGLGVAGAAKRHDCDADTAARMLVKWSALRRDEITTAMPGILGVAALPVAGRACTVAFCPSSGQIIDLVDGADELGAWIAGHDDMPEAVCLEIDAAILNALSSLPGEIALLVPPTAAARSIEAGTIALFRKLVRGGAPGRNYRESVTLFRKPQAALTDEDRDELKNWSEAPRKLRFVSAMLLHDILHGTPQAASAAMARMTDLLKVVAPTGNLARFLDHWSAPILRGVEDRWIDGCMTDVAALRREAAAIRPLAGYDRMRAIMMFATPRPASAREAFGPRIDDIRTTIAMYAASAS